MVSVLAFYSDDPSSNPDEVYNFSVKFLLKRTKINKKEAGVGPFKKKYWRVLGGRHSTVDSSAHTILRPLVRIPNTTSTLFQFINS